MANLSFKKYDPFQMRLETYAEHCGFPLNRLGYHMELMREYADYIKHKKH